MRISQEKLREIRLANPIEEVIGSYIPLKRVGKNFKSICPFHRERRASFFISPEKGVYHCFGCGKSGNVFGFLMEYNNFTYIEAVRYLAERGGIKLEFKEEGKERYYRIAEEVAKIYHKMLKSEKGEPGRKWLKGRGIKGEIVEKFMLGYAGEGDVIVEEMRKRGVDREVLEEIGVIRGGRDVFKRRIIFPIRNSWGKVIGFGSRVLDESLPKYLNSPDSPIFKKGHNLYGLYEAKKEIKKEVVLVEGYMDLLSVYQSGIPNVVGVLGTSLTKEQARLVKLYSNEVIIAFDGDASGREASLRGIDVLLEENLQVKVIELEEGEDPDSVIRKKGKFPLCSAKSFVEFKMKKWKTPEEKETLIQSFRETLNKITDPIKREVWEEEVAKKLGITKELLKVERVGYYSQVTSIKGKSLKQLEISLLAIGAADEKARRLVIEEKEEIRTPEFKNLLQLIEGGGDFFEMINLIEDEELRKNFIEAPMFVDDYFKLAKDYLKRIKKIRYQKEIRELREKIKEEEYDEEILKKVQGLKLKEIKDEG